MSLLKAENCCELFLCLFSTILSVNILYLLLSCWFECGWVELFLNILLIKSTIFFGIPTFKIFRFQNLISGKCLPRIAYLLNLMHFQLDSLSCLIKLIEKKNSCHFGLLGFLNIYYIYILYFICILCKKMLLSKFPSNWTPKKRTIFCRSGANH